MNSDDVKGFKATAVKLFVGACVGYLIASTTLIATVSRHDVLLAQMDKRLSDQTVIISEVMRQNQKLAALVETQLKLLDRTFK